AVPADGNAAPKEDDVPPDPPPATTLTRNALFVVSTTLAPDCDVPPICERLTPWVPLGMGRTTRPCSVPVGALPITSASPAAAPSTIFVPAAPPAPQPTAQLTRTAMFASSMTEVPAGVMSVVPGPVRTWAQTGTA